jgi:RNA polymerase sigma-70 factor, ECF subfamily
MASEVMETLQERDALEEAIYEYSRFVYRIAYSVLRNHHDAEDATQETFLRVLRYRRGLTGIRNLRTWLAHIAWRVALNRRKNTREVPLDEIEESIAHFSSVRDNADEIAITAQKNDLLDRIIRTLPKDLRDAITLSTMQELSSADIAAVLEIPESAVRSRIFRAREILKQKMVAILGNRHGT